MQAPELDSLFKLVIAEDTIKLAGESGFSLFEELTRRDLIVKPNEVLDRIKDGEKARKEIKDYIRKSRIVVMTV